MALHAFSAGGLLLGHLVNEMPAGMLAAAWAQAPFVDLLTASTNQHLPLTVHEYDEWGDPADPKVDPSARTETTNVLFGEERGGGDLSDAYREVK